jgi:peptidoglycan/LPS O-acetylase OafA/YrhL
MLLGRVYLSGLRMRRPGLWAVGVLGSLPLVPMCIGVFGPLNEVLLWPSFAVLLLSLAQGQHASARVLGTPALCVLGEASYGLYILHFPLHAWLERLGLLAPQWSGWPSFVAYAGLAVACALLSRRFVEAPTGRALRRMLA